MKNIIFKSTLLIIVFLIGSNSCTKEYLEVENPNDITREGYFKTEQHAFESVISCYDIMKSTGLFGLSLPWYTLSIDKLTYFEFDEWGNLEYGPGTGSEGRVLSIFDHLYRGMYRCNVSLNEIEGIDIADKDLKNRYLAEAHFFRGFYLFYLSTVFGTPPLVMDEMTGDDMKNRKNSEKGELLEVAIGELKKAAPDLPLKNNISMTGRVSRGAAHAMLGKCYLWKAQYDSAAHYFDKVISSGLYELVEKQEGKDDSLNYVWAYLSNFSSVPLGIYGGENNKASILETQNQFSPENDWHEMLPGYGNDGSMLTKYFHFSNSHGSWSNVAAYPSAANVFETPGPAGLAADPRKYATLIYPGDTMEYRESFINEQWNGKYPIYQGFSKTTDTDIGIRKYFYPIHYEALGFNDPNNYRVIRYEHVLLMYAEAQYHLGNEAEALDKINMLRGRVGMPDLTSVTPEDIIHETRVECMFEVSTIFHILRWSALDKNIWGQEEFTTPWITKMNNYIPNFVPNKHELLYIPQNEIDYQEGALVQNPGY